MGLMDKVTQGLERAAQEADKVFDKGKSKVGELQLEMQMDGLAKKLGYMVFDFYRGREIDQAQRQKYLDDMSSIEDKLLQMKAEAAARKQAEAEARAQAAAQTAAPATAPTEPDTAAATTAETATEMDDRAATDPVPPAGV